MKWVRGSFIIRALKPVQAYWGTENAPNSRGNWSIFKVGQSWRLYRDDNLSKGTEKYESEWPTLKAAKVAYLVAYATGQVSVC